jgi:drug/metabolite transporter (DMT)-like permease
MSVIWGIPYLLIRIAVAEISPAALVFARTSIAVAILLPVALLRVDLRPILARWRWLAVFAVVEIAIPWVMLGSAEQHVSSSLGQRCRRPPTGRPPTDHAAASVACCQR